MKCNPEYPMRHHPSTLAVVLLIGAAVAFCILFCSCESKSGNLVAKQQYEANHPQVKAVVLSLADVSQTIGDETHTWENVYRLKDVDAGVVFNKQFSMPVYYEVGDTILVRK